MRRLNRLKRSNRPKYAPFEVIDKHYRNHSEETRECDLQVAKYQEETKKEREERNILQQCFIAFALKMEVKRQSKLVQQHDYTPTAAVYYYDYTPAAAMDYYDYTPAAAMDYYDYTPMIIRDFFHQQWMAANASSFYDPVDHFSEAAVDVPFILQVLIL